MAWKDAPKLESSLKAALDSFNWPEVEAQCLAIIERIRADQELFPERSARILMQALRRKRRFKLMRMLAEAFLHSGLRTPQIRRQYAQALIDDGRLYEAEVVLQSIIHDAQGIEGEEMEARGLTGRIYKQLYVINNDPGSARNGANIERALKEYIYGYRSNPQEYLWHGINVVALSHRARRDNLPLTGLPDPSALAGEILATLHERERNSTRALPAYDLATEMEACVALERYNDAVDAALRYVDSLDADAFEIYSSLRQLIEVWQLNDKEPPGNRLLPILKAGHLNKEGATTAHDPKSVLEEAAGVASAVEELEAIFGPEKMVTLKWYKRGLDQCNAVARVEKRNGTGHGTGWLVNASDFFPGRQGVLLLTNAHVVSRTPNPLAIFPEDSQVNFQVTGQVFNVENEVVWSSPYKELDATFLKIKGEPKAAPLELHSRAMEMAEPPPRMYIIGHPRGRDLELSLQDNNLVACNETLLHYRTPTEQGSSGSPVFEPLDWRVVALHHKGSQRMKRIDGKEGTYQANEGISIMALQKATQGL